MRKQPRLKKYAVEFVNNIIHDTTEIVVEAYNKDEAIYSATMYIEAYNLNFIDDGREHYTFNSIIKLE